MCSADPEHLSKDISPLPSLTTSVLKTSKPFAYREQETSTTPNCITHLLLNLTNSPASCGRKCQLCQSLDS